MRHQSYSVLRSSLRRPQVKSRLKQLFLLLAIAVPITSVIAAGIVINTSGSIEFGQGAAQIVTCDEAIDIQPEVELTGSVFVVKSVQVSQIDDVACQGKELVVSIYSTSGSLLGQVSEEVTLDEISFDFSDSSPAINTNQVGSITAEFFNIVSSPTASASPTPTPTYSFVTTNLQMRLDASDDSSYSGTGTTWFDISGNGFDATLVDSPTFSSDNGGVFVFSGDDNYITLGNQSALKPPNEITFSQWLNATDWQFNSGSDYQASLSSTQGGGYAIVLQQSKIIAYLLAGGSYRKPETLTTGMSGWYYVTVTYDGRYTRLFIDSNEVGVVDAGGINPISHQLTNSIMIGAEADGGATPETGRRWQGRIATTEIYDRALSAAEIEENFNATKDRFDK